MSLPPGVVMLVIYMHPILLRIDSPHQEMDYINTSPRLCHDWALPDAIYILQMLHNMVALHAGIAHYVQLCLLQVNC